MKKTDKSTGFNWLTQDVEHSDFLPDNETLRVTDGHATFHDMQQVPPSFSQICHKVFDVMPRNNNVMFSTDMYKTGSIKSRERKRRVCGDTIIIKGDSTKRLAHWKQFLSDDENKKQFFQRLLEGWSKDSFASKVKDRNVVLICEGVNSKLTSAHGTKTDNIQWAP